MTHPGPILAPQRRMKAGTMEASANISAASEEHVAPLGTMGMRTVDGLYIYHISSNFICFFYIIETYRNYEYDKIRYVKNMRICDKTKLSTQFIMHVYIYHIYIWTPKTSNLTMGKFGGKSPASGHMVRYHRTHHLWDSVATQGMGQIPVTSPS